MLNYRLSHVVPKRMQLMEQAILDKSVHRRGTDLSRMACKVGYVRWGMTVWAIPRVLGTYHNHGDGDDDGDGAHLTYPTLHTLPTHPT